MKLNIIKFEIILNKLITSITKFKSDISKSYNIYYNNLKTIKDYLEKIIENIDTRNDKFKYIMLLYDYYECILKYCDTIPTSIYYEINNDKIDTNYIIELYKKIDNIHKKLDNL